MKSFVVFTLLVMTLAGATLARASARRGQGTSGEVKPLETGRGPVLMFRDADPSSSLGFGKVAFTSEDDPGAARSITGLDCVRVHFSAGQGICLRMNDQRGYRTTLETFGSSFETRWSLPVEGLPSRARVSPDGRRAAATVFVSGHAYGHSESSTRTLIVDLTADQVEVEDLEDLEIEINGAKVEMPRANFWGVTFAHDSNRFYATLSAGEKTWLVEGDLVARRVKVLRENVECPSLSPDEKRIAFKKRVGDADEWRLSVLDLDTLEDRPLRDPRNFDDQAEWLDDHHVAYGRASTIWQADVDDDAPPRVLLRGASSPAVVDRPR